MITGFLCGREKNVPIYSRGQQAFSVKGQKANTLVFASLMVSVTLSSSIVALGVV